MALATYSNLQTYVTELMAREDLLGNAADWITLAEARAIRRTGAETITAVMAQAGAGATVSYKGEEISNAQIQGVTSAYIDFGTFNANQSGRMLSPIEVELSQPFAGEPGELRDRSERVRQRLDVARRSSAHAGEYRREESEVH